MTKRSTRKGANFERRIAKILRNVWGIPLERTPQSGAWGKMRTKGDLVAPPEMDFSLHVECKNQEGWNLDMLFTDRGKILQDWWRQCTTQAEEERREPLLIFSRNLRPVYVRLLPSRPDWTEAILKTGETVMVLPDGSYVMTLTAFLKAFPEAPTDTRHDT